MYLLKENFKVWGFSYQVSNHGIILDCLGIYLLSPPDETPWTRCSIWCKRWINVFSHILKLSQYLQTTIKIPTYHIKWFGSSRSWISLIMRVSHLQLRLRPQGKDVRTKFHLDPTCFFRYLPIPVLTISPVVSFDNSNNNNRFRIHLMNIGPSIYHRNCLTQCLLGDAAVIFKV